MPSPRPNEPAPHCECGCGQEVSWMPSRNRWARYAHGHNQRGKPSANRKDYGPAPLCACGCGERVTGKRHGQWCKYLHGHSFRGKSHSREAREKMREAKLEIADEIRERVTGPDNPMWRGGHSKVYPQERLESGFNSYQRRKARKRLEKERGRCCERCGTVPKRLELHHVDHDLFNNGDDNLLLVCHSCQMKYTAEFVAREQAS